MRDTFFPAPLTQRRKRLDASIEKKRDLRGKHVCSGARANCEFIYDTCMYWWIGALISYFIRSWRARKNTLMLKRRLFTISAQKINYEDKLILRANCVGGQQQQRTQSTVLGVTSVRLIYTYISACWKRTNGHRALFGRHDCSPSNADLICLIRSNVSLTFALFASFDSFICRHRRRRRRRRVQFT